MQNMRGKRLSGEYQKAVYEIISTKLKYKTSEIKGLVSVTKADVSPDLKSAKIYISVYGKNREEEAATFAEIQKHAGFIRHELAQVMTMRTVPELHFFVDDSMEYGDKIDRIIKGIHDTEPKNDDFT